MAKQAKSSAGPAPRPARLVGNTITCPKSIAPSQLCSSITLHVCGTYEKTIKDVTVEIRNQADTAAVPNGGLQHAVLAGGKWGAIFHNIPPTVGAAAFDRVKVGWYEAGGVLAKQDVVRIRVGPTGTDCSASCAALGRKKPATRRAPR